MLPEVPVFEETVSLVSDTGIQFMDFAARLDPRKAVAGEFATLSNTLLTRLFYNAERDFHFHEPEAQKVERLRPHFSLDMKSSLDLYDGVWLPVPFFRHMPPYRYDEGPANWARLRMVKLAEPDIDGNTHRVTIAFDTRIAPSREDTRYLAPNDEDVRSGSTFKLATTTREMHWFLEQPWVSEWLLEVFNEGNKRRDRQDLDDEIKQNYQQAHYLNLLSLFGKPSDATGDIHAAAIEVPVIVVVSSQSHVSNSTIPVDLVLDVGNSRTCGILIENHGQAGSGLKQNYVLQLRDLTQPEHIYAQPFESRVEFSQADFGKDHFSVKSGRPGAFQWPTIARVGAEAGRLASRRRGTEGSTGLCSPKRYLWDEKAYGHGWRFNCAYVKSENEPYATAAPFSHLINETGEALYSLPPDDRLQAFIPQYSRSSLMTFMLAEVLTQALSQINSPDQRSRQGHSRTPRQLQNVILTVPPGMPQAERSILQKRMHQAVGLVWKSLGWHAGEEAPHGPDKVVEPTTPTPQIRVEWDEASCGQLVYLYTELNENFAGHPEEFFDMLARADKTDRERITLATIDIGGGTSDLVITDYSLDRSGSAGSGSNVHIVPEQRFRDGFKIAGDDILLDVIQEFVLPGFAQALQAAGVASPNALMSKLCGDETTSAQDSILRQQLNLQVFTPLGLELLKRYEQFDPEAPSVPSTHAYGELLDKETVSEAVIAYVDNAVRRDLGRPAAFDLLSVPFSINLQALHAAFLGDKINICKTLSALCEVVSQYPCDALLLTGRPSRLPGVQAFIRKMMPLPPGRILPMQNYRTGGWYPFHKNGFIDDPKSTASVGAMLFLLCANHSVPNFYFRTSALKPYSTIKHIGVIDLNNVIKDEDVIYRDIQSADGRIRLPTVGTGDEEATVSFAVRGDTRLGFRQLRAERWAATPLYSLRLKESARQKFARASVPPGEAPYLRVRLQVLADKSAEKQGLLSDKLGIENVDTNCIGVTFNARADLELELNTMLDAGLSDTKYWLDSGSVKRK